MIHHTLKSVLISAKKNRFFYFINLFGFITGFLVITVIFTFVYQELSFDSFHKNADNIYRIHSGGYGVTPPCFADKLRNQIPEITSITRFIRNDLTCINKDDEMQIENCYYTDPETFDMFSFRLLSGNAGQVLKKPNSIVLNQSTANKLFGTSFPIGETIRDKDSTIYTVTAVMEDFPHISHIQANALISIETLKQSGGDDELNCSTWSMLTYILLSENANSKETTLKINSIIGDSRMGTGEGEIPLEIQQLTDVYFDFENNKYDGCRHGNQQTVLLYSAISFLILLIVIINYINLSTLMTGTRIKEIAIRKINGATRTQIIQQSIVEATAAALLAFITVMLALEIFLSEISSLLNISIAESLSRSKLLLFYLIGIMVIALVTGLIPGVTLSRINILKALKNESVFSSRGLQRKLLLIVQLIIVAIMLNAVFIISSQMNYIAQKDLGFNSENAVYFELDEILMDARKVLKTSLQQNPNILSVSFSDGILGTGFCKAILEFEDISKLCNIFSIDPDYMDLLQLELLEGRNFSWELTSDISNSCIVNEETCSAFNIINPIGKKFNGRTIIGVVRDFHFSSLHQHIQPLVIHFLDLEQNEYGNFIQIKIHPKSMGEAQKFIEETGKFLSPGFDASIKFLSQHIENLYTSELELKNSFQVYSIVAFIIALLGLFGLFLFTMKKKAREMSIRKLFGATFIDIFFLLAKGQIWIVAISNIVAMPVSYMVMNMWLDNFQYRTNVGAMVFAQTFFITLVFTLITILLLVLKIQKFNLTRR